MVRPLAEPEDRHDPPARAVVHQLDRVDPARKRLRIARQPPRLVGAERVGNPAVFLGHPVDLDLMEAVGLEHLAHPLRILAGRDHPALIRRLAGRPSDRAQRAAGREQRQESIPVTRHSRVARDHVVEGGDDRVDGLNVGGVVGPFAFGLLVEQVSYGAAFLTMAACALLAAMAIDASRRRLIRMGANP